MARFVCFGEILMRLNAPGKERLFQTPTLIPHFVGAEANVAVALSHLNNNVQIVTTLPQNPAGYAARDALRTQGTDTANVRFEAGRLGLYFFEQGALSRPSAIIYDRAGSAFAATDPQGYEWDVFLDAADWLHLSGINLALGDKAINAAMDALITAKAAGVKVSFDCNFRPSLWAGREAQAPAIILDAVRHADLIFAGPKDAGLLLSTDIKDGTPAEQFIAAADAFFDALPGLAHIAATHRDVHSPDSNTLTGFFASRSETAATAPLRLDGIVDRIGAGDAFAAGLLHAHAQGQTLQQSADFALAAAGLAHSVPGDFSLFSEKEILAAMAGSAGDVSR